MLSGVFRLRFEAGAFALGHILWKQGLKWLLLATVAEVPPTVLMSLNLNDISDTVDDYNVDCCNKDVPLSYRLCLSGKFTQRSPNWAHAVRITGPLWDRPAQRDGGVRAYGRRQVSDDIDGSCFVHYWQYRPRMGITK
ncbi:hypothetical protein BGY98DRAFT_156399 [Russula aff. rugulosa BPL654]|nr:hypothetical protein BGY98DRAFT_156399 [Russula aff. rugulosa BPL654]